MFDPTSQSQQGDYARPQNDPIVQQPGAVMTGPGIPLLHCPPGLENLLAIDQILVKQKVELGEAIFGVETQNKYSIKNNEGQEIFFAIEDGDCLTRMLCGQKRKFDMKIFGNTGNEVIHIHRPLGCMLCCFPNYLQRLEIFCPPGNFIGSVAMEYKGVCNPVYNVKNQSGDVVLRILPYDCSCNLCEDMVFNVINEDGTEIGKIAKKWSGLAKEVFTDADNFGISFPADLDVYTKVLLLGGCILLDFIYFEGS